METDFDFKPINEGLGFHRKVKPLETETDSDESFSFSSLGPGTMAPPAGASTMDANSREQSKGLLSSGSATAAPTTASSGKSKHNAKSVSDLIAALPPSLDFLLDDQAAPAAAAPVTTSTPASTPATASTASSGRRAPLFSSPSGLATPGAPAAASMANAEKETKGETKRGFLQMPIGRSDYGLKSKAVSGAAAAAAAAVNSGVSAATPAPLAARTPASIDENVAKTFPQVFPHLGSLAGKPAAAALAGQPAAASLKASTTTEMDTEIVAERALSTHFGSAILDTLVAVGLGCLLLVVTLSITNVNLLALLENSQTDRETIGALALLFVAGGLLYVLAARSFVGATLGEWSYEIRVGDHKARTRWFYPVLVMWRGLLVTATGFVLFPIISAIAGTDVLKYLTGLELVSINEPAE